MPLVSVFRPVLLVIGLAVAALLSPAVLGQQPGSTAADGFNPNVNGTVYAVVVQPDGKVLVAGNFTALQPTGEAQPTARANIARLLPDGRNDATFNAAVNGQISALVLQPNGQIVIGGKFTSVAGATRRRVARLNADGTLDATFDPNIEPRAASEGGSLTPEVTSLLLQPDGKLIVGGGFTAVQPNGAASFTLRNRIARFLPDGALDTAFDPNANSMVLSLALQPDGRILVGGGFTTLQPNGAAATTARQRIARLEATGALDPSFDPRANNAVSAIQVMPDGRILIGGTFTQLQPNGGDAVTTGATRLARLNADGTVSANFSGYADGPVSVITLQPDGGILVGGSFAALGSGGAAYVGRLLPTGTLDATFLPLPNYAVYAIAVQANGSVILGGGFLTVGSQGRTTVVRNHVARVSFRGALDADFRPDVNGRVRSLVQLPNGQMLVGGSFTSVAGQTRSGVVRLNANGTVDQTFQVDANGPVLAAVQLSNGQIIIGGAFTRVNGETRSYLARLNADGSVDLGYDPAPNSNVNAMVLQPDGKLLIAGAFNQLTPFSTPEPVSRTSLARINADGTVDITYTAQANDAILAMAAESDNQIIIAGSFSAVRPNGATTNTSRFGMARLNADGTLDTGFDPNVNGTIAAVAVQADGKVVFGGSFAQLAPNNPTEATTRNNLARVEPSGALDATFNPNVNGPIASLAVQGDGKIVIAGRFSVLRPSGDTSGQERNFVARINPDGTLDNGFNLYLDTLIGNEVVDVAITADNKILVAGAFNQLGANGVQRSRVARINHDGSVDTAFNSDLSATGGADIRALTQQFNGHVLAAGDFASFSGTGGENMARFFFDSSPDTGFVPSFNGPVHAIAEAPQKGATVTTQRGGFAWLSSSGALRNIIFGSELQSMTAIRAVAVDAANKLLIAATFDVSGASSSLVRFNQDGSIDPGFQRVTTGTIYAVRVLADGKILVGGTFTTVGGTARNNLARLNTDGTLDAAFTVAADNAVYAITVQPDGKILLGGNFSSITGGGASSATPRNGIARLNSDATLDTSFDPNGNGQVQVILMMPENKILVGGGFTGFRPNGVTTTVDRAFVARLNPDGTVDTAANLQANGFVGTGALQSDGKVVLGGFFTSMGGTTRNYLARLNADMTLDATFNPNPNGSVNSVAVQADNKILASGIFTAVQPGGTTYNPLLATPRNRLVRLNNDGSVDPLFNPNFDGQVTTVTAHPDGSIVATGAFTTIQPSGSLMVGGAFNSINGVPVNNLAIFGNDGSVSAAFIPNPNGAVNALLAMADGRTVAAGAFTQIAGAARNRIARFSLQDQLDPSFDPNANGEIFALALEPDGDLLLGGSFSSVGGAPRNYLARIKSDGTVDAGFAPSVPGVVRGLAVQANGRILVLADGSGVRNVLLRLTAEGAADPSFASVNGGSASINSFALQTDGRIVVGGGFTSLAGAARNYIARLNANGTLDPTFTSGTDGEVTAVLIQRDGKILLGGRFTTVDGLARAGLARIATATSNTGATAFTASSDRRTVTWVRSGVGPEISSAYFETSADLANWTTLGQATRVPNTSNWQLANITLPADPVYVRANAIVASNPNSSTGLLEAQGRLTGPLPAITSAAAVSTAAGSSFLYAISATGGATSYVASGLPAGLTLNPVTGIISGTPAQAGTYQLVLGATNAAGTVTTPVTLIVGNGATTNIGRVLNLSVNAQINANNPLIIAGFVITGTGSQTVLLRAVGPGLTPLGVNGVLATPHLRLHDGAGRVLHENIRWGGASQLATEFARLGATPLAVDSEDAAMIVTLPPGPYTMHVSDRGTAGGIVLAEVYDASPWPPPASLPHLVNISARGVVTPGQLVTGGFVISGETSRQVLVRGVGPGLAGQGVASVLANPQLTLYKIDAGNSRVIARNNNWATPENVLPEYPGAAAGAISTAAGTTGAFALAPASNDAAILITLPQGVYTAEVSGVDNGSGAALVEVYEVQ